MSLLSFSPARLVAAAGPLPCSLVSVPVLVVARVLRACACTSVCVYVTRRTATAAYYHRSETFSLTFVEERT